MITASLPPYKDETHMEKHSTYNNNFGDMMIPNSVLEKTVNVSRNIL